MLSWKKCPAKQMWKCPAPQAYTISWSQPTDILTDQYSPSQLPITHTSLFYNVQ